MPVTKVIPADFAELFNWLIPTLQDTYPELSENGVVHWLKAASADREFWFSKCGTAVGLFYLTRDVLDPRPEVVEKFVRTQDGHRQSLCELYAAAGQWAVQINARSLKFNVDAGSAPMVDWIIPTVQRVLNVKVKKHSLYIAPLDKGVVS